MSLFSRLSQRFTDYRREARIRNLDDDMRWLMKNGRFSEAHQVASRRHDEMNARSPEQRARMVEQERRAREARAAARQRSGP